MRAGYAVAVVMTKPDGKGGNDLHMRHGLFEAANVEEAHGAAFMEAAEAKPGYVVHFVSALKVSQQ